MHTKVCNKRFNAPSCDQFWGVWFVEGHVSSTNIVYSSRIVKLASHSLLHLLSYFLDHQREPPHCICLNWLHPLQLLLPDCVRFSCCSPIASVLAAAPWLCPPQLLLPRLHPLQLLLPNCIRLQLQPFWKVPTSIFHGVWGLEVVVKYNGCELSV